MTTSPNDLSVAQRAILTTACERKDGLVLPLTIPLKGGAVNKVLGSLITKGFVEEMPASGKQEVFRTGEDGTPITLKATPAAYEALGLAKPRRAARSAGTSGKGPSKPAQPRQRAESKQAQVIAMLKRAKGATVPEVVEATGWLTHTVRGFFAGALKKRLGLTVTSHAVEGRGRVYRMEA